MLKKAPSEAKMSKMLKYNSIAREYQNKKAVYRYIFSYVAMREPSENVSIFLKYKRYCQETLTNERNHKPAPHLADILRY